MNHWEQLLSRAIKDGKHWHLFDLETGNYVVSFFFPSSAERAKEVAAFPASVKYLTVINTKGA
jgi:hypothetical protein